MQLRPSCSSRLHSPSFGAQVDPLVSLMKVEKVPDSTYDMVGGLDQQIKEIKEASSGACAAAAAAAAAAGALQLLLACYRCLLPPCCRCLLLACYRCLLPPCCRCLLLPLVRTPGGRLGPGDL